MKFRLKATVERDDSICDAPRCREGYQIRILQGANTDLDLPPWRLQLCDAHFKAWCRFTEEEMAAKRGKVRHVPCWCGEEGCPGCQERPLGGAGRGIQKNPAGSKNARLGRG